MNSKSRFTIVLPSNSNPERFPNNEANKYSVEFNNPIYLSGKYEVAMVEMTYKNEIMTLKENSFIIYSLKVEDDIFRLMSNTHSSYWTFNVLKLNPLKMDKQTGYQPKDIWNLFLPINDVAYVNTIKTPGKGSNKFYYTTVKVFKKNVLLVMSPDLAKMLHFSNSCFTSKFEKLSLNMKRKQRVESWYVSVIPLYALQYKRIILKSKGEIMTFEKFEERWRENIPSEHIEFKKIKTHYWSIELRKKSSLEGADWCIFQIEDEFNASINGGGHAFLANVSDELTLSTTDILSTMNDVETQREQEWAVRIYERRLNTKTVTNKENVVDEIRISLQTIDNIKHLLDVLNVKSDEYGYKFGYSNSLDRITLSIPSFHRIQLDEVLQSVLGFVEQSNLKESNQTAVKRPMLKRNIDNIFVYCNIIEYIHVGNTQAPLLRQIPISSHENRVVDREFINKIYIPVNCNILNTIDISIHDQSGVLVPFKDGLTTVTLEFRQM